MTKLNALLCAWGLAISVGCASTRYVHVGENWGLASKLEPSEESFKLTVKGRDELVVGEPISFRVTSAEPGKLWILQVDPEDNVDLVFPNERQKNNGIVANKPLMVPAESSGWDIRAREPVGESMVVFIVTTGETKLDDVLGQGHKTSSEAQSALLPKTLAVVESEDRWALHKQVIRVRK